MEPFFEAINECLDPNPAKRIIWSTHDQTIVRFADEFTELTEHMRCALTYKKSSSDVISLSYGGEGKSRIAGFTSVLKMNKLPSNVHFGISLHDGGSVYANDGDSAITAHIGIENGVYVVGSIDCHFERCARLGFPIKPAIVARYITREKQKQFWVHASDLSSLDVILETTLTNSLQTPLDAVRAIKNLYDCAK